MTLYGQSVYKIQSSNPDDLLLECDRIFSMIGDRLDKMEGHRGQPELYNLMKTSSDVVVLDKDKGVVLTDNAEPPHYWRITVNSAGTLVKTDLGRNYE